MRRRTFRAWPRALGRRARKGRGMPVGSSAVELTQTPTADHDGPHPRVIGSGGRAFPAIVERLARATRSVEIRAFLWRDDEAGNLIGDAVLAAADRGVQVLIHKDRIAAVYEYTGGNKQSFFHKRVDPIRGMQAWFLGAVYRAPGSFKQRPNPLSAAILAHPQHHASSTSRSGSITPSCYIVDDRLPRARLDGHRRQPLPRVDRRDGRGRRRRARRPGCASGWPGSTSSIRRAAVDFLVHSREAHRKRAAR